MGHTSQELGSTQDIEPGLIKLYTLPCVQNIFLWLFVKSKHKNKSPCTSLAILATYLVLGKSYTGERAAPECPLSWVTLWAHYAAPSVHWVSWCPPNINIALVISRDIYFTFSSGRARLGMNEMIQHGGHFSVTFHLFGQFCNILNSCASDILTTQWEVTMVCNLCHPDRTFTFSKQMLHLVLFKLFLRWLIILRKFVVFIQ